MADIYRFWVKYGSSYTAWYYTNARSNAAVSVPDPITGTPASQTFTAIPIKRIDGNRTLLDFEIEISMPANRNPLPQFAHWNPASVLRVDIWDSTGPTLKYSGRVGKVHFKDLTRAAVITCRALGDFLNADIPRATYGPRCRFDLFDSQCGVTKASFKLTVTVLSTGYTVLDTEITKSPEVGANGDGYYSGGYVECGGLRVYITNQTGDSLYLLSPFVVLPGTDFDIYPGCIKTYDICNSKFSNTANFGGFADVPEKNPVVSGF